MMSNLDQHLFELILLLLLSVSIYIVIIIVYIYARAKYKGGLIEQVLNMIIGTTGFLLISDISLFLTINFGLVFAYTASVIFKIFALIILAIGGLRLFVE